MFRKHHIAKEVLFPEITIDYETTIVDYTTAKQVEEGVRDKDTVELFAYSVQIGLCWQEVRNGKTYNRFEAHIFLDERLRRIAEPDDGTILHLVNGDCVIAAIMWVEDLFYSNRRTRRTDWGGNIVAHAFNAGYEESYSLRSLFNMGYESDKFIRAGLGGTMISSFSRRREYVGKDGEIKERKFKFTLKETARQWAANVRLSEVFDMYGLGGKTQTPLISHNDNTFYFNADGPVAWIDKDFLRYAAKDVVDLFRAVFKKRIENGQPKTMTASSTTLLKHKEDFIEKHGEEAYEYFFREASLTADRWLRPYSLGGYNYVNPIYKGQYFYPNQQFAKFLGIDRTNAYLSCMCAGTFPVGDAIAFYGQYEENEDYPFFYQKIRIKYAYLKEGFMPPLQWKHGTAEDVYSIDANTEEFDRIFVLNREEIELVKKSYKIEFEYINGYMYKTAKGEELFGDYLKDKFYRRKDIKAKIAQLKADATLAPNQRIDEEIKSLTAEADTLKLWGNGLYGKFFENPDKEQGRWYVDEDNHIVCVEEQVILEKRSASHIGSQILRLQRMALIEACNKVIAAGGKIIQCDTDAFLCALSAKMADLTPEELCNIAGIEYGEDLGQWHLEKDACEGISVEKKVYAWSRKALTPEERKKTYRELMESGHKFFFGTRGVKKGDAINQLTPETWRAGSQVETTQFARLADARRGQIRIKKMLAQV